MITITNDSYIKLVQEDLNWLEKQEHSLEKDHIVDILKTTIKKKDENYVIDMIVNDAMQIYEEHLFLIDRAEHRDETGKQTAKQDIEKAALQIAIRVQELLELRDAEEGTEE